VSDVVAYIVLALLAVVALIGALAVALSREVMRMALGLGAFLLAIAGLFAYFGFGFLALAELFVYVGGVLILILFAIMLVHRTGEGSPDLAIRPPAMPALIAVLLSGLLFWVLRAAEPRLGAIAATDGPRALAAGLLGPLLPQFEIAGALLLVALVAVVVVSGGDRE
jgi:NADH:ubiquinone oxidoreductase subunit 6 (subunit J)